MKRLTLYIKGYPVIILLLACSTLLLFSCDDNDDQGENTNMRNMEEIRANITSGTWIIELYNDSGEDETGIYAGYSFSFNSNGTLVADNGNEQYNGTWSVSDDDDSDDDNSSSNEDDIDFNIAFSTPGFLAELTDDWDIDTYSSSRIELFDISGGDNTTDLLTFRKN
ncbi:hypothetical protein [Robertkochia flava]|uniref:hypothetical protein n=1 Tax=Robertkochia flava TaxID=3447986 RepID=UPI001CCE3714|nr:hypothetical protein [Robertkochia marina]